MGNKGKVAIGIMFNSEMEEILFDVSVANVGNNLCKILDSRLKAAGKESMKKSQEEANAFIERLKTVDTDVMITTFFLIAERTMDMLANACERVRVNGDGAKH